MTEQLLWSHLYYLFHEILVPSHLSQLPLNIQWIHLSFLSRFYSARNQIIIYFPDWSSYQERRHWLCRLSEPVPTVVISLHMTFSSGLHIGKNECMWLMRWYHTQCAEKARFPCSQWSECNHSTFIVSQKSPWRQLPVLSSGEGGGGQNPDWEKTSGINSRDETERGWVAICHAPGPPEYTET